MLWAGDVSKTEYCTVELTEEKYQAFVYAVKSHYWYQMYIDDLPIWGMFCLQVISRYLSNNLYQDYGLWHTQVLSVLMKLNDFLIPAVNAPAVVLDSGKCFSVHQLSLFVVLLFACAQVTGDGLEKSNRA